MNYRSHPAWRNQWWRIASIAPLPIIFVLALIWEERHSAEMPLRVVLVAVAALFGYLLTTILYHRYLWRYTINTENIESCRGLIGRQVRSIRLQDLRNINVNQTLMQRILGVGDVEFSSSAGSDVEVVFFGVHDPMGIKALAQRLQDR
ncbi:MAG: PH domain-containing protein [Sulfuricaulis sp.]